MAGITDPWTVTSRPSIKLVNIEGEFLGKLWANQYKIDDTIEDNNKKTKA